MDLSLNKLTNDLDFIENDLVLTSDSDPNGQNPILQDILQKMRLFLGEWFLNNKIGVPYLQRIFIKNPKISEIEAVFINLILSVSGVDSLIDFSLDVDYANRSFSINFSAQTTRGIINYSGTNVLGS